METAKIDQGGMQDIQDLKSLERALVFLFSMEQAGAFPGVIFDSPLYAVGEEILPIQPCFFAIPQ